MPEKFGLLGAGAQADEIEEFAKPDIVAFRAVDASFVAMTAGAVDIGRTDARLLDTPVVAAVGAPGLRRDLVSAWRGTCFRSVVAEQAWLASGVRLGEGVMVAPHAAISIRASIGDHTLINLAATVSHDTVVGRYATVSPGVHIAGHCRIGDGVFLGIGASVIHGVRIASGSVIGAGAAVVSDILEPGLYVGVPARRVRLLKEWLHAV
jgi:sugar O-acyltransferase (sialic acid O-acetyltransferase NeuD family)